MFVFVPLMPYLKRDDEREAQRRHYNERYESDAEFREKEAARKAEWFQRRGKKLQKKRRKGKS